MELTRIYTAETIAQTAQIEFAKMKWWHDKIKKKELNWKKFFTLSSNVTYYYDHYYKQKENGHRQAQNILEVREVRDPVKEYKSF